MKKLLIGILLISTGYSYAQTINAEQIKKDNVTIRGNTLHQLRADTTFLATKYYVDSVAGGGTTFDTTAMSARIDLKVDSVKRHPATDSVFYYTNGTEHFAFIDSVSGSTISASAWALTGNTGTTAGTNFIGTIDAKSLQFKTNSLNWMTLDTTGHLKLMSGYNMFIQDTTSINSENIITNNIFVGDSCGYSAVYSSVDSLAPHNNVGIGRNSMKNIGVAWGNTGLGDGTLQFLIGSWGYAGHNPGTPYGNGYENTAIGFLAGGRCDTCYENVFVGVKAGYGCEGCRDVTFVGVAAGMKNKASGNTFVGAFSGRENTTGIGNTFLGGQSGTLSTTASNNTFIGSGAGASNVTGFSNTFLGSSTGFFNTGSGNTYIGTSSGINNTGNGNLFLGSASGSFLISQTGLCIINPNSGLYGSAVEDTGKSPIVIHTNFPTSVDSATTVIDLQGQVRINDGNNTRTGKIPTLVNTNGLITYNDYGLDTTANDSATINTYVGMFKVASSSATFTLINSKIQDIKTLTFFQSWNPGNSAHLHINSKSAGVVVIGFDPAPNQDTKVEFQIRE